LFDLLFRRQIRIDELNVSGLLVDVSKAEPAEEREPFEGILMDLPMPLHLNRLRVEGQAILPGLAEQPMLADFVLTGGGFAPDHEGELKLVGELESSGQIALLAALDFDGKMTVLQGGGGRIDRASVHALVSAITAETEREETLSADVL